MSVVKMSLMPASMLVVVSTTVDVVMPSGRRSPSRAISARPRVISAALVLSPTSRPSHTPAASATTFFSAPPSSTPTISSVT